MFNRLKIFGLWLLVSFIPLSAEIHEISSMKEIVNYVNPSTLIIFDIDNTILESCQSLGGDQWFCHSITSLTDQGIDSKEAVSQIATLWEELQYTTKLQLVEENTAKMIHQLQAEGYPVFALTTRFGRIARITRYHLAEQGIDMKVTAPSKEDYLLECDGENYSYYKGILFTHNGHKGKALWSLLDKIGYQPKHIVFINDKHSHLVPVQETSQQRKVPFVGLRYGAADLKVKNFRAELAQIQMEFYGKILSDEAAEAILKSRQKN